MDVFVEQIVRLRRTPMVKLLQIFIILFAAGLCVFIFGFIGMTSNAYLIFPISVGVMFGAWKLIGRYFIEFEYSFTNGTIDIDKIINKKSRKRLMSTECKSIESYGKYDEQAHKNKNYRQTVFAANPNSKNLFCIVCEQEHKGTTLLVIEPDKRFTDALLPFITKRAVKLDDRAGN